MGKIESYFSKIFTLGHSSRKSSKWKDSLVLPIGVALAIAFALAFGIRPQASGLGVWYEEFAQIIRSGFAIRAGQEFPTFPMWGYGFLLAMIPKSSVLVFIQIVAGLTSLVWLLLSLGAAGKINRRSAIIGLWIGALFLPWHAMVASAYSAPAIAVSLMLVAVGFLVRYLASASSSLILLFAASVAFGLSLNFRSDYFAFTLVIAAVICLAAPDWKRGTVGGCLWLTTCAVAMVPWMVYTYGVTGRPLITSTNTGHVLYLGWGDLPSNRWGIRVNDNDPVMQEELLSHFGQPVSSLNAKGDRFLRKRFTEMLHEDPGAYLYRMAIHGRNLLSGGFFPGVWDQDFRLKVRERFPDRNLNSILLHEWRTVMGLASWGTTLAMLAELQGRIGLIVGLFVAILAAWRAARERDWIFILLSLGVAYQLAMSVVAPYLRPPLNNQIVPLICIALWWAESKKLRVAVR